MKFSAIILALFILSLSALPCDDVRFDNQQSETLAEVINLDNHSQHSDLCSPFCICICCTGVVLEPTIQRDILISEIHAKELHTRYIDFFTNNLLTLISQPPQV